jgi:hypothetical protein
MPDDLFGADRRQCDVRQGWIASRLGGDQTITAEEEILHPPDPASGIADIRSVVLISQAVCSLIVE